MLCLCMDLGSILKKLRLKAGLTQAQLADRLKIDRSAVAHIEAGKATTTTILLAWLDACGGALEIHAAGGAVEPAVLDVQALTDDQQKLVRTLVIELSQGNVKSGV